MFRFLKMMFRISIQTVNLVLYFFLCSVYKDVCTKKTEDTIFDEMQFFLCSVYKDVWTKKTEDTIFDEMQ